MTKTPKAGSLADEQPNSVDDFTAQDREYLSMIESIASGEALPNEELATFRDAATGEQQVLTVQFGREVVDAVVAVPEGQRTKEAYMQAVNKVAVDEFGMDPIEGDRSHETAIKTSAAVATYAEGYFDTVK